MSERDVHAAGDEGEFTDTDPAELDPAKSVPRPTIPFDADEADAADQSRIVELDEDDYR